MPWAENLPPRLPEPPVKHTQAPLSTTWLCITGKRNIPTTYADAQNMEAVKIFPG